MIELVSVGDSGQAQGTVLRPSMSSVCAHILSYLGLVAAAFFFALAVIPYIVILIYPYMFIVGIPYLITGVFCFVKCCSEKYVIKTDSITIFNKLKNSTINIPKDEIDSVEISYPSFCDCFNIGNIEIKSKFGKIFRMMYVKDPISIAGSLASGR